MTRLTNLVQGCAKLAISVEKLLQGRARFITVLPGVAALVPARMALGLSGSDDSRPEFLSSRLLKN